MLGYLCISWGFAFLLIALALDSFPPLTLVTIRLVVGALILYLIMRWQGLSLPRERRWWLYFVALSIMGNLLPFTLISWGQLHIPSGIFNPGVLIDPPGKTVGITGALGEEQ